MSNKSSFALMYLSFFIYSLSSILSKLAAQQDFLSLRYILCFCGIVLVLGVYAILWQQVLKYIPLSVAMSNKPVALILSFFWAFILFDEVFNLKTIAGAAIILIGIIIIGVKHA